ncbi:hypothetical protein SFC43_27355 [Bacteroides sp. CR5/BHMF/2]|nr:hypothetical protein [Bacteroides sp. CR5/BHMF/2]
MAEGINIEQIVQEVLDRVLQSSTGVEDMETITSLTGVKSLPGQKGDKLVNVPFELISKVANDAATRANAAAKEAEESIAGLEDKTQDAIDAAKDANDAAAKAEDAVELVENTTIASLQGLRLVSPVLLRKERLSRIKVPCRVGNRVGKECEKVCLQSRRFTAW